MHSANSNGSEIEANVWESEQDFGGALVVVYNVTTEKSCCDEKGEWHDVATMREANFLVMARLLTRY